MKAAFSTVLFFLFLAGICVPGRGQFLDSIQLKDGSDQTVTITAEGPLTLFYGDNFAEFNKSVVVHTGGQKVMNCEKLTIYFAGTSSIDRMVAEGQVALYSENVDGNCQRAEYTAATDTFVMTGDPSIRKGRDHYAADRITIFRREGRVLFEPSARLLVFEEASALSGPAPGGGKAAAAKSAPSSPGDVKD